MGVASGAQCSGPVDMIVVSRFVVVDPQLLWIQFVVAAGCGGRRWMPVVKRVLGQRVTRQRHHRPWSIHVVTRVGGERVNGQREPNCELKLRPYNTFNIIQKNSAKKNKIQVWVKQMYYFSAL